MKTIKYTEEWDFHKRTHILIMDGDNVAAKGCVVECEEHVSVDGIYVQPEYRGKGLGYFLMEELEQVYLAYTQIFLKVKADNKIAKKLYEKFRFAYYKTEDPGIYEWMLFENKIN